MRITLRSAAVLAVASLAGALMLAWPLLAHHAGPQPPFLFLLLLPAVVLVVLAELTSGGLDPRILAILGILSAIEGVLRGVSAGVAGVELVFFLLILGGRVFGPAFGFALGCTSLFVSALLTAGVGSWLPFQMLVSAWLGLGAGLLPARLRGRAEIAMLVGYAVIGGYVYGALLDLQGWPLLTGVAVPGHTGDLSYVAGASSGHNLATFLRYEALTGLGWDTGRAITSGVAVALLGPAVLTTLRRAARRATVVGSVELPSPPSL
jgi:energy-coupling factor transport system substrate-specific component